MLDAARRFVSEVKYGRSGGCGTAVYEFLWGRGKKFYMLGGFGAEEAGAVGAEPVVLVISLTSTRRFAARPALVLLVSTGLSFPSPMR